MLALFDRRERGTDVGSNDCLTRGILDADERAVRVFYTQSQYLYVTPGRTIGRQGHDVGNNWTLAVSNDFERVNSGTTPPSEERYDASCWICLTPPPDGDALSDHPERSSLIRIRDNAKQNFTRGYKRVWRKQNTNASNGRKSTANRSNAFHRLSAKQEAADVAVKIA